MTIETWQVQFNPNHLPHTCVKLKRSHEHASGYELVMVDLVKLVACFERDQLKI